MAARVFRALGMRILKAKKSKYYHEALANFEDAKNCYEGARMSQEWDTVVAGGADTAQGSVSASKDVCYAATPQAIMETRPSVTGLAL